MDNEKNNKKTGRPRKSNFEIEKQTGIAIYKNPEQKLFLERYLSEIKTDDEWAKEFNVSRMTIYRWKQESKYEINRILNSRIDNIKQELTKLSEKAIINIKKSLNDEDKHLNAQMSVKVLELLGIDKKNPVELKSSITLTEFRFIYTSMLSLIRKHFGKMEFKSQLDAFNEDLENTIEQWRKSDIFFKSN